MFIFIFSRSSRILSIHVFCCLPLLLVPSTYPYKATDGNLSLPILITCPSHFSLFFLILSIIVSVCPSSLLVRIAGKHKIIWMGGGRKERIKQGRRMFG